MHYYKHDHHTGMNPKWRGIAAERGVRPLDVYGIWSLLLEHASRQQDRGSVAQFSAADIAAQYDLEKSDVEAILTEFEARGMIANGRVANWDWYQRDLSTARVQKHREERRAVDEGAGSPGGDDPAPERAQGTETEVQRDETDVKRDETDVKRPKTQKNKSNSKTPPLPPLRSGSSMAAGSKKICRHRTGRTLARALVRRYPKPSARNESTTWSFSR
jgi:hypothetical protein